MLLSATLGDVADYKYVSCIVVGKVTPTDGLCDCWDDLSRPHTLLKDYI